MVDPLKKILEPIKELQNIRGIDLPIGLEFLQLVVTGPPGAGKSYYIEQIRGWPNEGYLDLAQKGWWKDQSLIYRPREVHLGLPFVGVKESLTVFDEEWLSAAQPLELDFARITIPPAKSTIFNTDWRNRYIFEFLIPPPSTIYSQRLARQSKGYFPADEKLSLEIVSRQVAVYREVALYLHRAGLNVYVRKSLDKPPMWIAEQGVANAPPWTLIKHKPRPSLKHFEGWKWLLGIRKPIKWINPGDQFQDITTAGRIAHDGRSFVLCLGEARLRFQPEITLGTRKKTEIKNWLITTVQSCSARQLSGFVRVRLGETVVIGTENEDFLKHFQLDDTVAQRHVSVTNLRGDLVLTPLSDRPTRIVRLDDFDYRERLTKDRHKALLAIRRIFGQRLEPLGPEKSLRTIQDVNDLLLAEPYRPLNALGQPGGIISLPPGTTPVIVGDLHAQVDNLLKILSENCLLECLRLRTATLVLLGDAVHSENAGEMDKFETSMLIMDLIFKLKLSFPHNLFYIRGNHDSFDAEINKNGILQGEAFKQYLMEKRGGDYVANMDIFYQRLAYIIHSDTFLACHAGPPVSKVSRKRLTNIQDNPQLARELTHNRLQRPNHLAGYSKSDVRKLKKCLQLPAKARFIVGHTPLDPFGSFWLHAGGIKNHHILYSAHTAGPSMLIYSNGYFMPITLPAEPLAGITNDLL